MCIAMLQPKLEGLEGMLPRSFSKSLSYIRGVCQVVSEVMKQPPRSIILLVRLQGHGCWKSTFFRAAAYFVATK